MRTRLPLALVMAIAGCCVITAVAQSPHPFGTPTPDLPNPAETITAVPGMRAQGWLMQGRSGARTSRDSGDERSAGGTGGSRILRRGGNAIDAAVAAGAMLDVTSQNDTGIGGDLFALIWSARDKKLYGLASAGWAPAGWTPEFFIGQLRRTACRQRRKCVHSPRGDLGVRRDAETIRHADVQRDVRRAARTAEEGWPLAERRHSDLSPNGGSAAKRCGFQRHVPHQRRSAAPLQHHSQPALAAALRLIQQQGRDAFYRGDIAAAIVEKVRAGGA